MFNRYNSPVYGYITKYITVTVKGNVAHIPIRKLGVVR